MTGASLRSVPRRHSRFAQAIRDFWTAPVTPRPLAAFRIGLAAVLLAQALSEIGHLQEFYGRYGIVEWSVTLDDIPPGVPTLAWVEQALTIAGLPATFTVPLTFTIYVGSLFALLLGYRTRWAAVLAWLAHMALMNTGAMVMYGVDRFAQIGLFYCLWFPVGQTLSLDAVERSGSWQKLLFRPAQPSFPAWLGLRVLQLHVCIAYVASGVEKALGEQWWNGEAVWRALMGGHGGLIDCSFLADVPRLAQGLCWMTLLLEAGCVLFVWHPRARKVWLAGIVGMHLGIALTIDLWIFSATMIVFDLAAFGGWRVPAWRTSFGPAFTTAWATAKTGSGGSRPAPVVIRNHNHVTSRTSLRPYAD